MKPTPTLPANRVASIDAYRGLVMFLMMAEVLEPARSPTKAKGRDRWAVLELSLSHHAEWTSSGPAARCTT